MFPIAFLVPILFEYLPLHMVSKKKLIWYLNLIKIYQKDKWSAFFTMILNAGKVFSWVKGWWGCEIVRAIFFLSDLKYVKMWLYWINSASSDLSNFHGQKTEDESGFRAKSRWDKSEDDLYLKSSIYEKIGRNKFLRKNLMKITKTKLFSERDQKGSHRFGFKYLGIFFTETYISEIIKSN